MADLYDIRTSAEAMAERFDKMKEKWEKKGKGTPQFSDFVEYMKKDHSYIKYGYIFFTIMILGIAAVNIIFNIENENIMWIAIVSLIVTTVSLVIFRFAMNAIKEVREAQCVVLEQCTKENMDIYEYVRNISR